MTEGSYLHRVLSGQGEVAGANLGELMTRHSSWRGTFFEAS